MKRIDPSQPHHSLHIIINSVFCVVFCLVITGLHPVTGAPPADYYYDVDTFAEGTINTGCEDDVDDNDCSLRGAITLANGGSLTQLYQINLPAGTYTLTIPGSDDANAIGDLDIYGPTTRIVGGGMANTIIQGSGTFDRIIDHFGDHSLYLINLTIQNGNLSTGMGGGGGIRSREAYHLDLDGVRVTSNFVSGSAIGDNGGGLFIDSTDLTVQGGSSIDDNDACNGGGIYISNSFGVDADFYSSAVSNNEASCGHGGGIYVTEYADLLFNTLDIDHNRAEEGAGFYDSVDTILIMNNSRVFSNTIINLGAGTAGMEIHGDATIDSSNFSTNNADSGPGAMRLNVGSDVTITDSLIYENDGGSVGGIFITNNVSALLQRVEVSYNSGNNAGGINIGTNGRVDLENVTIAENDGFYGGGLYLAGNTTANLNHVTIADNLITGLGGAVYISDAGVWNAMNSIIAYDGPEDACYYNSTFVRASGGYNIISDGSCGFTAGTDLPNTDPGLADLDFYFGIMMTMQPRPGSPAIDGAIAGDPVATDQLGNPRIDGDGDGIIKSDIGAREAPLYFFLPIIQAP
jgi:hypothetical protein